MKPVEPIRQALMIEASQERTFHTFVRRLSAWWPIEGRAAATGKPGDVRVEEWVGGRVYQAGRAGAERERGHVTIWNPPSSFAFTWEVAPGAEITEVHLQFQRLGPALTRVVMVHRGWECLSTALLDRYTGHAGGWLAALRRFAAMFETDPRPRRQAADDEPR
ncbi:SRPBCC domain-containing protein [Actinomadura litoris]|uniref:Activator of Hsp90 ATPase homologue 1/2-like C-terminal domain-containing protein n=1 Tax=Actinomadura litoris TaxID=2678616 RepID=A0A7K1LE42_9ACTN|nr:SRPBCC domain-containing protein [Actinomadura litoris]MUN42698.1 hypothetical protein [Actinomadura litoris]